MISRKHLVKIFGPLNRTFETPFMCFKIYSDGTADEELVLNRFEDIPRGPVQHYTERFISVTRLRMLSFALY